jgi:O-antigen/teichoic acid export membrane protein
LYTKSLAAATVLAYTIQPNMSERHRFLWQSSAVLTLASLAGAAGNYLFQAIMGRLLPLSEFGHLNAALGLAGMVGIGVAAASQAVTHHLARHQARDEQHRVEELKAASSAFLFRLTVLCSVLAIVLIQPISVFFHVPRATITLWVLATILVSLWGGLANAWCAGLGQFQFMAALGLASVAVRIAVGALGGRTWNAAETGVAASAFCALTIVGGVLWRDRALVQVRGRLTPLWEPEFLRFLLASFAVCVGNYAFLQSDVVVAQRWLNPTELGAYTAAGLFGRAVVLLPLPILTVFFTARSGQERSDKATLLQLAAFTALLLAGAGAVMLGKGILCRLLLSRTDAAVLSLMNRFALVMVPVGVLQAFTFYALAARRFRAALVYGGCGLVYGAALTWWGRDAQTLLLLIGAGATATAALVVAAILWDRARR